MGTLTADDIRRCRDFFDNLTEKISGFLDNIIDNETRNALEKERLKFSGISQRLTGEILEVEIADLATPMAEIDKSIDKVNEALQQLEDGKQGINLFARLFEFGSQLATAATGGVIPILGTILQAIDYEADNLARS